jgi:hypothetical protein
MSSESFELAVPTGRAHMPSPIESNDSDQSEIIRLPARPSSRVSAGGGTSSSSSIDRLNKATTEYPSHIQIPFEFSVNEDHFLQDLPTPVPR